MTNEELVRQLSSIEDDYMASDQGGQSMEERFNVATRALRTLLKRVRKSGTPNSIDQTNRINQVLMRFIATYQEEQSRQVNHSPGLPDSEESAASDWRRERSSAKQKEKSASQTGPYVSLDDPNASVAGPYVSLDDPNASLFGPYNSNKDEALSLEILQINQTYALDYLINQMKQFEEHKAVIDERLRIGAVKEKLRQALASTVECEVMNETLAHAAISIREVRDDMEGQSLDPAVVLHVKKLDEGLSRSYQESNKQIKELTHATRKLTRDLVSGNLSNLTDFETSYDYVIKSCDKIRRDMKKTTTWWQRCKNDWSQGRGFLGRLFNLKKYVPQPRVFRQIAIISTGMRSMEEVHQNLARGYQEWELHDSQMAQRTSDAIDSAYKGMRDALNVTAAKTMVELKAMADEQLASKQGETKADKLFSSFEKDIQVMANWDWHARFAVSPASPKRRF